MAIEVKDKLVDSNIKYFGSLDKNIFESYKKVIKSRIRSGRDADRLITRLDHLLIENSK